MAHKKANLFGYRYIRNTPRKRPGRHSKKANKRNTPRKRSRGQGK